MENYELSILCDSLKPIKVNAGEYIIRQGEIGSDFFIIEDGIATVTINKDNEEEIKHEIGIGDYFGEIALIKDVPRTANVIAKVLILFNILD